MVRPTPRVKALWERVRRPVTMFAIGAALAAPASAFMLREDAAGTRAARLFGPANAAVSTGSENSEALASVGSSVTDASWSAARAAGLSTLRLSKQYNVPLGLATEVHKAATAAGIPPRVAFGLVRTESAFRRTAVSPVGAIGYTQVMPGTASTVRPGTSRSDLFDARTNLSLGFKYLKTLVDRYDGNLRLALTAYNRGPGTVDRLVKRGRDPENGYASLVLANPGRMRLTPEQKQQALATAASDYTPAFPGSRARVRRAAPVRHATTYARRPGSPRRHASASRPPKPAALHPSGGAAAAESNDRQLSRSDRQLSRSDRQLSRSDRQPSRSDRQLSRSDRHSTRSVRLSSPSHRHRR